MILRGSNLLAVAVTLSLAAQTSPCAAETTNAPDFKEVYGLLRAHLPGATDDSLNQSAVAGLLAELSGKARLLDTSPGAGATSTPITTGVFNDDVGYLGIGRIDSTLADGISQANQKLSSSNKLAGTIIDLRFAAGDNYEVVKSSVDLLVPAKKPLIVLVDGATSGAAELLAAQLRGAGALLIGNPTAGLAMTTEDFPLSNGQRLRVATAPVVLHGTNLTRLQPDITVPVSLAEERDFMKNPVTIPAADDGRAQDTNMLAQLLDHTSEADLVRQRRKDGATPENPEPPAKSEAARPFLRDPVLARAVDLVEGLAVVQASHP